MRWSRATRKAVYGGSRLQEEGAPQEQLKAARHQGPHHAPPPQAHRPAAALAAGPQRADRQAARAGRGGVLGAFKRLSGGGRRARSSLARNACDLLAILTVDNLRRATLLCGP